MKPKPFSRWLLPPALLTLTIIGWYCKRDTIVPDDQNGGKSQNRTDCNAFICFESETTTYGRLVNQADGTRLKPEDHLLMMPHRERYKIEGCYKTDGSSEIIVTYLTPQNPIVYPVNTVDAYYKPDYSKVVMINGWATYYDQAGAVMRSGPYDFDLQMVNSIVDAVSQRQVPTQAVRDKIFELLQANDITKPVDGNSNLITMKQNNPDGSYTIQLIDKTTLGMVGNIAHDASGSITNRTMIDIGGTAENPILKSILFDSRFQAVSDPDIPLRLVRYSQIDNFVFTKN
jgi:hypothetical protein